MKMAELFMFIPYSDYNSTGGVILQLLAYFDNIKPIYFVRQYIVIRFT